MGSFLYFGYGSNMLVERLVARCPSALRVGLAIANAHRLDFAKRSIDSSGKATLIADAEVHQHGVLFEIDQSDRQALDREEGAGKGYERVADFSVERIDTGGQELAVTYLASDPESGLKPFDWYLALVIAGAQRNELPDHVIEALQSVDFDVDTNLERKSRVKAVNALAAIGFRDYAPLLSPQ